MKYILSAILFLSCSFCIAQDCISINGSWQFFLAKNAHMADSLAATGFENPAYDAASFHSTPVPSCWAVLGYEEPVYRGYKKQGDIASEGFYRHTFRIPESMTGQRMLLHFGGVWASAEVWINGQRVGRHDSGYTSFSFDVSRYVKAGQENLLAVRVRQVYPGYQTDTYDDWTLGGIYRDVELESMPAKRWIDRVRVSTKTTGEVTVKVMVADNNKNTLPGNYMSPGQPYQLRLTLSNHKGETVASRNVNVKAHTANSRETCIRLQVSDPHLWTAETPYLYNLKVEQLENGHVAHIRQQRIGIREISTAGGVLRINGVAVKLRGVNLHDEHPDVGRATTREHWLQDLNLMKQANINYIRACHYQHAKGLIELCDSIGMYVGAEISLGGADNLMYDPAFLAPMMLRTMETVERDLNNPSILYWSIGNEDSFTDMFLQAARTVKGLDPSRPTLLPWNADDSLPEEIDILAPHYWTAKEYDSIASQSSRPIITTEYVHAYGLQRMGGLDECWKALTKHPAGAGGAVWVWADQGLKTPTKKDRKKYGSLAKEDDYLRLSPEGWDGITDSYRRPTRDYWEVKAVYCPIDAELKDGKIIIKNNYDFTSLNTVNIHWQTFAEGIRKAEGNSSLDILPHASEPLNINTKGADYIWLTFTDRQGKDIGKRWLELRKPVRKATALPTASPLRSTLATTGLPAGFRPTIWHKLNDGDQIIKNRNTLPNPEKAVPRVVSFNTKNGISRSKVVYELNDSNRFEASYTVTNERRGITIEYEITPQLQTSYVPVVGLAYTMNDPNSLTRWFGLGPDEAYPNKQTATLLGVWDATLVEGTRAMRWIEVDGLRIYCDGYWDRDSKASNEIRLLSHVLGRSEKGRLNNPEYRLPQGNAYRGTIFIQATD